MKYYRQFQALPGKIKKLVFSVFGIVIYALVGFFLLPLVLQPIIEGEVSKILDRSVTMRSIEINPFSLSVTINQFLIKSRHADFLFLFDSLYVNFQAAALFKQAIGFDEIRIVKPAFKIMLLSSGQYNFQDIIENYK